MHMPIDMNNQPIINVGSPAGFKDVVSKTSLRTLDRYQIKQLQ